MKTRWMVLGFVGLISGFMLQTEVQAQFRNRGGGGMGSLLRMEEVQKEIKLEGDKLKEVTEYLEGAQSELRAQMQELQDQGLPRDEMMQEMQSISQEAAAKDEKALVGMLDDSQINRLKQLMVQQMGPAALARPDIAKAVGLSAGESEKIKAKVDELQKSFREKMQEAFQNGDREAIQGMMQENQKQIETDVLGMLSDAQKKKFEEFKGAKFEFPQPQRGGGRRARNDF